MKKLYLFGGGGHSLSCIDVIEKQKKFKIKGIIDKKFKIRDKIWSDFEVFMYGDEI